MCPSLMKAPLEEDSTIPAGPAYTQNNFIQYKHPHFTDSIRFTYISLYSTKNFIQNVLHDFSELLLQLGTFVLKNICGKLMKKVAIQMSC